MPASTTGPSTPRGAGDGPKLDAESVAFILCQAAGLTTAAYSFGYVAGWSGGDPSVVKATAERVVTTARDILDQAWLLDPAEDSAEQEPQAA